MLRRRLLVAVASTVAALAATSACSSGGGRVIDSTTPGQVTAVAAGWQRIDPIAAEVPTDDPVGPAAEEGSAVGPGPTLVNIWASTCGPCRTELPLLQEFSTTSDISVVGVSRDTIPGEAVKSLDAAGVTYANYLDPGAELAVALDGAVPLNAIPASVLLVDGKAIAVHVGAFEDAADLREARALVEDAR